jgi:hypothetical protein
MSMEGGARGAVFGATGVSRVRRRVDGRSSPAMT